MDKLADYEPLEYYSKQLKDEFEKNARDYFEDLVKRSGVNEEENAATVKKYKAALSKAEEEGKRLSSGKALRGFVIFVAVAALVAAAILFLVYFGGNSNWVLLFVGILCVLLGIAAIVLLCTKLKQLIKLRQQKYEKAMAAAEAIKQQALEQMRPLHALFTWNMTRELVLKTLPFITLDEQLDVKRLDLFIKKYGFRAANADSDSSTVFLLSGTADGNPFLFERKFCHRTISKRYSGSLTIHWVTYTRDSNGNTRTVNHSQTLVAHVEKPAPAYDYETCMYYGNEAAPDLTFSRYPKHSHALDDKEREKMIKSGGKELAKKSREAIKSGTGGFTEIANTEFEVLFGATNRNNEVQFRLMFTPLAQNNMVDLVTSREGYGDDFAFYKMGKLNCIRSDHAQSWQTDANPARYMSYDLAAARAAFLAYNTEYFKSFYFDLAPVLSVPLYRMQKPREFIYRDVYGSNYTEYEAEATANRFDRSVFAPPEAKTESILKASFIQKDGAADKMAVTAYSFDAVERIDYVPVLGGDGYTHNVPVPWIEYIPVSRTSEMELKDTGLSRDKYEEARSSSALASFVRRFSAGGHAAYCDGLLGIPVNNGGFGAGDDKELSGIFGLKEAVAGTAAFLTGIEAVKAAADMLDKGEKSATEESGVSRLKAEDEEAAYEEAAAADATLSDTAESEEETPAADASEEEPEDEIPAEGMLEGKDEPDGE